MLLDYRLIIKSVHLSIGAVTFTNEGQKGPPRIFFQRTSPLPSDVSKGTMAFGQK